MEKFVNTSVQYSRQRPILIGVLAVLAVVSLGFTIGVLSGFTTPYFVKADGPVDGSGGVVDTGIINDPTDVSGLGDVGNVVDNPVSNPVDTGLVDPSAPVNVGSVDTSGTTDTGLIDSGTVDINPSNLGVDTGTGPEPCCTLPTDTTPDVGIVTNTNSGVDIGTGTTPCCTLPSDTAPDKGVISNTNSGVDTGTGPTPCCTLPETPTPSTPETPTPVETPPVVTPPVVTPPVITPPVTPPQECPTGDTGTFPNCVPPPPPSHPAAECISLTATPNQINSGDAVTLAWKTKNATKVTIDNGVGDVTPVASGSTVVHPTHNTTYTATVSNANGSVNCQASVTLTSTPPPPPPPPPGNGPSCNSLTASATNITPGQSVTLTWSTSNASSVSIDNGIGNVTPVAGGSITVNPTQTTTYTATVPNAAINSACHVTITVSTPPPGGGCTTNCGGGGGGGGGGFGVPGQFIAAPTAAYVTLSQIPYTGLDLGPVGTVVYWVALIVFCASATYLTIFNIIPFIYRRLTAFGVNVGVALNTPAAAHGVAAGHGAAQAASMAHGVHHATPSHAPAPTHSAPVAAAFLEDEGFRSFARGGTLTIDDIVKGLARETGSAMPAAAPVAPEPAHHVEAPAEVMHQADPISEHMPVMQAPRPTAPAREATPAAKVSTDVRDFIRALLNADRDTVFATIRQIVREGGDAEMFITQVVCALDDAYRARIDGTSVNPEIAQMTQTCATSFLERLTAALTNAVDSSYSPGITGAKLALTRALAAVEG